MYFNHTKAQKAQEAYCDEHEIPTFAPAGGICPRCGYNIYLPTVRRNHTFGITVEQAASTHITSCPHCSYSFVE